MKTIRIVLLILIIIGLVALATQKLWVPKIVNRILESEGQKIQPDITLKEGRQCYTYTHEKTKTEPYATTEFIDITLTSKNITGTKSGTQNGPDMTNGYTGTLKGELVDNKMIVLFSYTIEGSKNKEGEIYTVSKTGIDKLRYPLIEDKGVLVPDQTKEFKTLPYARVGCTASN